MRQTHPRSLRAALRAGCAGATLLAPPALAGPDPEEIAADAERAAALIERCKAEGPACGATEAELGHAFITSAVAAAVLRGEVDARAAANGRFFDPSAAEGFEALLAPPSAAVPDGWVLAWDEPRSEPEADTRRSQPLVLDGTDPTVVHVGFAEGSLVTWIPHQQGPDGEAATVGSARQWTLQARVPLGPRVSLASELEVDHGLQRDRQAVRLGLGPRLSSPGGSDLHLIAGVAADRRAAESAVWGGGVAVGAVGLHPLAHGSPVAVRWEAWHQQLYFVPLRVAYGRTELVPSLRWCPGRLVLSAGARLVLEDRDTSLAPAVTAGWTW